MIKNASCFLTFVLTLSIFQAQAVAITLGADAQSIKSKSRAIEAEYSREMRKIPGATNTYFSNVDSYAYSSTLKMRSDRKVGAGLSAGGSLGAFGFNAEFNFEDENGVLAGFGVGQGYNSVQLAWKHALEGDYLAPYTTVGYSRWYNSSGGSADHRKSDILDRILTAEEKSEGRFGTDFVNAAIGVQYNQLSGDLAGLSFFGELTAMVEIKRSVLIPNGAVGILYYF